MTNKILDIILEGSTKFVTSFMTYPSVTPGKGEYGIFECVNGSGGDVAAMVVPVPTKNFAGVYIFKSVYNHIVVGPTNVRQVGLSEFVPYWLKLTILFKELVSNRIKLTIQTPAF